jgi:hypothetical protein
MGGYVDLQNFGTTIDEGDAFLRALKFENAVIAYQSGVDQGKALGVELSATDPHVIQASTVAAQLAALDWHLASQATAEQAQSLIKQMQVLYQQAYNAHPDAPIAPLVKPPVAPLPTANKIGIAILWAGVAAGLGFLAYTIIAGPKVPRENPSGGSGGSRRSGSKKALIAKGRSCLFEMVDGSDVRCSGGMLHDPSGRWWPKKSVLCGPFRQRVRPIDDDEYDGEARHYLGSSHKASIGSIDTPPKGLSGWDYLGEVDRIFYTRTGRKSPGRFQHGFNKSGFTTFVKGKGRVRLYRRGRYCRLELPRGALLDSRGFVWP